MKNCSKLSERIEFRVDQAWNNLIVVTTGIIIIIGHST